VNGVDAPIMDSAVSMQPSIYNLKPPYATNTTSTTANPDYANHSRKQDSSQTTKRARVHINRISPSAGSVNSSLPEVDMSSQHGRHVSMSERSLPEVDTASHGVRSRHVSVSDSQKQKSDALVIQDGSDVVSSLDATSTDVILKSLLQSVLSLERTMQEWKETVGVSNMSPAHQHKKKNPHTRLKKEKKVTVYIRIVFLKIGEIDTVKENFYGEAFIQSQWREPDLDSCTEEDFEDLDLTSYWNPELQIENGVGEVRETTWHNLVRLKEGGAMIQEKKNVKGTFLEYMELNQFPFDTQDLSISVGSQRSAQEVVLQEDPKEGSCVNVSSFVDEQEWSLHSHCYTKTRIDVPKYKNNGEKRPVFTSSVQATRRSGFFVTNILLVMFFISALAFATFTVDVARPQNRLQLSFTLVLTVIAFKMVVNQCLPKISYLTYLDKYILTCMCLLCIICVWHAVVPQLFGVTETDEDDPITGMPITSKLAKQADWIALVVLVAIYLIFHVAYIAAVKSLRQKRKKEEKQHLQNSAQWPPPRPSLKA